ncbi:hypothetical protein [Amycolatopsis sp. cg13]|uniref:hypothetical protein n=1 Tax=Amycolatopsis sp. cg13 TaxID=3238807 RepID=UPI003524870F
MSSKAAKQQSSKAAKQQSRWRTFDPVVVLGVVRTWTSAIKLLEVCRLFQDDQRIRFTFTVDRGSRFSAGVEELLARAEAHCTPWENVPKLNYALAITASENIDFDHVSGPVLVLPHGVGFHKYVPDSGSAGTRLSGLIPSAALRSGRVLMALSHPNQQKQLQDAEPLTDGQTVLIGDPQFEQLLRSEPHRDHYRAALGVTGRKFVLVSSTWGETSLIGRRPRLPAELLAALDYDSAAVGLVLHPNVWSRYRPFQIRSWFAAAEDAGLLLLPPERGWQAAIVAADVVIGDHGSVSLLAAATGRPLLLGAFGNEVVPGTSAELLGQHAARLTWDRPLRDQIEAAKTQPWQQDLAERTFASPHGATAELHALILGLAGLEPRPLELLRAPDPEPRPSVPRAFTAYPEFTDSNSLTLHRFPRSVEEWRPDFARAETKLRHVVADESDDNLGRIGNATVLTRTALRSAPEAWCANALRLHPACTLAAAATPGGCVARTRDGNTFTVTGAADVAALASALHACLATGRESDRPLSLRLGSVETTVVF